MPDLQIGRFSLEDQERIIHDQLVQIMNEIITEQEVTGVKASGESAKKLRVETTQVVNGQIVRGDLIDGSASFRYQEDGRGPDSDSPAKIVGGLWGKIYTWLRYKKYGLEWSTTKDRIGLAWAITKKIQKYGTYTYFEGEPTGVLSKPLDDEKFRSLREKILTIENVTEIKDILTKGLFA